SFLELRCLLSELFMFIAFAGNIAKFCGLFGLVLEKQHLVYREQELRILVREVVSEGPPVTFSLTGLEGPPEYSRVEKGKKKKHDFRYLPTVPKIPLLYGCLKKWIKIQMYHMRIGLGGGVWNIFRWDVMFFPFCMDDPIQAYADLMRSFRDTFRSFLGGIITASRSGELGEFQCYDKIGMREWGYGGPIDASSLMQNPESTEFFRSDGSWNSPYGEFFLEWYSGMLLLHGERICKEAETIFRGNEVNMSGKVGGFHWHYGTQSHPSELTCGYITSARDGYIPIVRMFGRYSFTMCCSCFEMQDAEEQQINPASRPESFLKQLLLAARICDIHWRVKTIRQIWITSHSNRMDKNLFEPRNWVSFSRFVRQMSAVNMFQASLDSGGGHTTLSPPSASAFAGTVLAY
ncbi:Beta-amylase 3, chloroplastic, partial [Sesamum angolense]